MGNNSKNGIKFESKEQLSEFLANRAFMLNEDEEYNIMVHEIQYSSSPSNKSRLEELENVWTRILTEGFIVNYPTIFGTMALMGNTSNENLASKIVNYKYYSYQKDRLICLFAIPKYVKIGSKVMEFSSFNGTSAGSPDKELVKTYNNHRYFPDLHDFKCCILDLIKSPTFLPKCYTLGAIKFDSKSGEYIYYENEKHISLQNAEFKKKHTDEVEKKAMAIFSKYQTDDIKEIMVGEYKEELKWINSKLDFDV